ncbi:MAG: nicotinate (nicotinamide) nucleotide adenylyltransferase [Clostridia bacterium]|nr:nicotinate (nicotinamide) nucleotide adenylyltransferase [Clostridia bacterium]
MAKIGIYGGSFNPPHIGHILAAKQCRDALELDRVIVIPAAIPPHKALADGSPNAEVRLRLTELAVSGLDGFSVSDMELRREGPSYTVDTLRQLREEYPQDDLYLMMGTDMFLSFDEWFCPDEIARLATIVCFTRYNVGSKLRDKMLQQKENMTAYYGKQPILLDNDCVEISSTEIRRLLTFKIAEPYLDEKVLREICRQGLYGTAEDYRQLPTEELRRISYSLHKPGRVPHVEGCCETAVLLAGQYGDDEESAARAAILHDVTKALTQEQQLLFCKTYGVEFPPQTAPQLMHAITAAKAAEVIFGECEAVCSAIRWHTTGKENMTKLQKIVYIADMMEPTRSYPGVERVRQAVWQDLDEGVREGLKRTIEHLLERGIPVSPESQQALRWLQSGKDEQ